MGTHGTNVLSNSLRHYYISPFKTKLSHFTLACSTTYSSTLKYFMPTNGLLASDCYLFLPQGCV